MTDQKLLGFCAAFGGLVALIGAIVLLVKQIEVPTYLWFIAITGLGLGGFIYPMKDRTEK